MLTLVTSRDDDDEPEAPDPPRPLTFEERLAKHGWTYDAIVWSAYRAGLVGAHHAHHYRGDVALLVAQLLDRFPP